MIDSLCSSYNPDRIIANYTIIYTIAMILYTLATIAIVWVAKNQLSNLNETFKVSLLGTVINLESEMNKRKEKMDEIAIELVKANATGSSILAQAYQGQLNSGIENYLNSLDRFCYCIVKGYISENDWKEEYLEIVREAYLNNEEQFNNNSFYKNIRVLRNRWIND